MCVIDVRTFRRICVGAACRFSCAARTPFRKYTIIYNVFWLFSLQNDESLSVGFKLRVRELKDMKILNSLWRPGDIDRIFLETK